MSKHGAKHCKGKFEKIENNCSQHSIRLLLPMTDMCWTDRLTAIDYIDCAAHKELFIPTGISYFELIFTELYYNLQCWTIADKEKILNSPEPGQRHPPCWIILSVRGAETWRRIGRGGNRAHTGSYWPLTYLWGKDRWLLQ